MVAYSFQRRFIEPIEARTKQQTIRRHGKRRHARVGDTLQLYFGMRTQHCRLITTATCLSVCGVRLQFFLTGLPFFTVDGRLLDDSEFEQFARNDGFKSLKDMQSFWRSNHPCDNGEGVQDFRGLLISWGKREA